MHEYWGNNCLLYTSSVAFNFADPKEVKIEVEGSEEPFYVELVKDTTDVYKRQQDEKDTAQNNSFLGATL